MTARAYIATLPAVLKDRMQGLARTVYITDCLQVLTENTARLCGGRYIPDRYAKKLFPQKEEARTAEEVIDHIKKRLSEGA